MHETNHLTRNLALIVIAAIVVPPVALWLYDHMAVTAGLLLVIVAIAALWLLREHHTP